jgi:alkyl hydroperoxide reductase subunit AhpC
LDTAEARKVLASIKRDLRRVTREVQALQSTPKMETQSPVDWDMSDSQLDVMKSKLAQPTLGSDQS